MGPLGDGQGGAGPHHLKIAGTLGEAELLMRLNSVEAHLHTILAENLGFTEFFQRTLEKVSERGASEGEEVRADALDSMPRLRFEAIDEALAALTRDIREEPRDRDMPEKDLEDFLQKHLYPGDACSCEFDEDACGENEVVDGLAREALARVDKQLAIVESQLKLEHFLSAALWKATVLGGAGLSVGPMLPFV